MADLIFSDLEKQKVGVFVPTLIFPITSNSIGSTTPITISPPSGERVKLTFLGNLSASGGNITISVGGDQILGAATFRQIGANLNSGEFGVGNTNLYQTVSVGISDPIIGGIDEDIVISRVSGTINAYYSFQYGVIR